MSKITKALLLSLVAFGLAACETNPPKAKVDDCTYPSSPSVAAPDWVCTESIEGAEVSATGSERIVGGETDFAQQMAAASARLKLAQRLKTHVSGSVKKYMAQSGVAGSASVDKVNESVTKQITDESLIGSRIAKTKVAPDGMLYVLVIMDEKSVQNSTEKAVKSSMGNNAALWQQFKAQKGHDELAADIAKMKAE